LRLTHGAGLLAPTPQVRKHARRLRDGTITVTVRDTLGATDGSVADGRCAICAIVDHASRAAWLDAAPRMDRVRPCVPTDRLLSYRLAVRRPGQGRASPSDLWECRNQRSAETPPPPIPTASTGATLIADVPSGARSRFHAAIQVE
jgi:hypothetical protein